jgi:hypothetical protein
LLGYTVEEISNYFGDYLAALAGKLKLSTEALREKIRHWYNGYRFSKHGARVYNPFSCLHVFKHQDFSNYWFESGTATFLLKLIEKYRYDLTSIDTETLGLSAFSSYEIDHLKILPLLFQTGYLTIKDYLPERNLYRLGYPNYEVENSLLDVLVETYSCWLLTPPSASPEGCVTLNPQNGFCFFFGHPVRAHLEDDYPSTNRSG